ncbi:hypothetical protein [Bacteriovorax sp. BSW11_IV]|uniref:hypothetical protein n=1 Tax=Bacteriovorax sp. BSW11_IV TaxID=1353529 RepID=UPI0012DF9C72|nr:hypothetical protein [Bacteriovorax sp. BSW11_IV]
MTALNSLHQSALDYQLSPISIREIINLSSSPCDIYVIDNNGLYIEILRKNTYIDNDVIKDLLKNKMVHLFVKEEQRQDLIEVQQQNLRLIARSLSIGNAVDNGKKLINLLTINMRYLYEYPMDDNILNLQYQGAQNLFRFLYEHSSIHEQLYLDFLKFKHHYIFAQPFLSSLFLLGVLKMSHLFSEKEIEGLFITSYFKDVGMSAIPIEKYDEKELSEDDKRLLTRHADLSVEILHGRLPLSPNHFKIIEGHHSFSKLDSELGPMGIGSNLVISGIETVFVSTMDIFTAMTSPRPYREATSLFEGLEMIKKLISEEYPNEFRIIVTYFKNFFAKTMKKSG